MIDGWYAVFEIQDYSKEWMPVIQAEDMVHAKTACNLIEPCPVQIQEIC